MSTAVPDSYDEVRRLRSEAEDYARKDDMLAAAMLDQRASFMSQRLNEEVACVPENPSE